MYILLIKLFAWWTHLFWWNHWIVARTIFLWEILLLKQLPQWYEVLELGSVWAIQKSLWWRKTFCLGGISRNDRAVWSIGFCLWFGLVMLFKTTWKPYKSLKCCRCREIKEARTWLWAPHDCYATELFLVIYISRVWEPYCCICSWTSLTSLYSLLSYFIDKSYDTKDANILIQWLRFWVFQLCFFFSSTSYTTICAFKRACGIADCYHSEQW